MKNIYISFAILFGVISCERIDESALEHPVGGEQAPLSELAFSAVIEEDADTKTILVDGQEDGVKKVLWQPGDAIGVAGQGGQKMLKKFTTDLDTEAATAEFHGGIAHSDKYIAFYPYSETLLDSNGFFVFDLPKVQKYVGNSFDPNAAPMVAKPVNAGDTFEFYNLCGLLALNLTGDCSVKSIVFRSNNASGKAIPVSGKFEVNTDFSENPGIVSIAEKAGYSVCLDCETPVQLSSTEAKTFHIMLPPGEYTDFNIVITSTEGEIMIKEGKSPVVIERSHIKPTGALGYAESDVINLSSKGTSNCYIITEPNLYSFDATVIGNGTHGFINGAPFPTKSSDINPVSAKLLWTDRDDVIQGVTMSEDGKIKFLATGIEGNALIAATDAQDQILWSWHIWVTDTPRDQLYVNTLGEFTLQDRNLGATRSDRGTESEWLDTRGLYYQWGRKDPFMGKFQETYISTQLYMDEIVGLPTTFVTGYTRWLVDQEWCEYFWSKDQKTIYDPCPVGYRVSDFDAWYGFSKNNGSNADRRIKINAAGSYDCGYNFYIDDTNTAWFPATGYIDNYGPYFNYQTNQGEIWSSSVGYSLAYTYYSDYDCYVYCVSPYYWDTSYALPVRCMKDSYYEQTQYPKVKFDAATKDSETSMTLTGKVTYDGWGEITEVGFIWGISPDLSDGQLVIANRNNDLFNTTLYGLAAGTMYFVQAYAKNQYSTAYSSIHKMIMPNDEESVDNLSLNGTANCYIVKPVEGTHSFYADVEGNSNDKIYPVSAEVLWEVDGDRNICSNIIDNVRYTNGWILFDTPSDVTPGNALIVAKDQSGTIIWSWHIWVTDFDSETDSQTWYSGAKVMDRNLGAVIGFKYDSNSNNSVNDNTDNGNLESPSNNEGFWIGGIPSVGNGAAIKSFSTSTNSWDDFVNQCNRENDKKKTWGALYQQGRKDPMVYETMTLRHGAFNTIQESYANPNAFSYADWSWTHDFSLSLWYSEDGKTKYDPCPPGWRLITKDNWTLNDHSSTNYGKVLQVGDTAYSYFPYGEYMYQNANYYQSTSETKQWVIGENSGDYGYTQVIQNNGLYTDYRISVEAYQVRCMKDE